MTREERLPNIDKVTGLRLLHGNGCHKHHDCFTCPFPDCTLNYAHEWYIKNRDRKANSYSLLSSFEGTLFKRDRNGNIKTA